ncbi:unnamed protein product [Clonostachys rosea]|uniref:Uncharacterized protein n=1 Tax=Bionectria ochroleuca TaxID=29856 RepID=A0ABY6U857_BIOOC|nr:unnamed protein product [Clonostachys rosea]
MSMSHHHRLDFDPVEPGDDSWMDNLPSPPPLSPTPPPPEEKKKPVRKPRKNGIELLRALEEEARKSRYGASVAHLKYSEIDWTVSMDEFAAGKCLVKGIDCRPTPLTAERHREHFLGKNHLDWEVKMRKKAEAESEMAVDQPTPPAQPTPTSTKRKFGDAFPASDNGE